MTRSFSGCGPRSTSNLASPLGSMATYPTRLPTGRVQDSADGWPQPFVDHRPPRFWCLSPERGGGVSNAFRSLSFPQACFYPQILCHTCLPTGAIDKQVVDRLNRNRCPGNEDRGLRSLIPDRVSCRCSSADVDLFGPASRVCGGRLKLLQSNDSGGCRDVVEHLEL